MHPYVFGIALAGASIALHFVAAATSIIRARKRRK